MSLTNCRFYEEKYPEIDSFVMVNVGASSGAFARAVANITLGQTSMCATLLLCAILLHLLMAG